MQSLDQTNLSLQTVKASPLQERANSEWRLLLTGQADGAWNMALDEAIMQLHATGAAPNTIRFYGWDPACISIGYFQSLEREIDLDQCKEFGIDYVRRPTGGRVVLHDAELTYSIVVNEDNPLVAGSVKESYRKISQAIVIGMRSLGLEVESERQITGAATKKRTGACFDSRSDYELSFDGRKLVGSAQFRRNGVVLQHGSILLDADANLLFSLMKLSDQATRRALVQDFGHRVVTLREALGREAGFNEVAKAVTLGFEELLVTPLKAGELSLDERSLAENLKETKYASMEWNYRK